MSYNSVVVYTAIKPVPSRYKKDYEVFYIGSGNFVYVRLVGMKCKFEEALDKARPRKWEAVSNSHPLNLM